MFVIACVNIFEHRAQKVRTVVLEHNSGSARESCHHLGARNMGQTLALD
jgi:hypothetical protein